MVEHTMKKNTVNKKDPKNNMRRRKNNNKFDKKRKEKQIVIKRSSGRHEKFDINRMTQTVSRSGVPFLMARDISKNVSNKIRKDVSGVQARQGTKDKTVSADQIRAQVAAELRDRNRSDIA